MLAGSAWAYASDPAATDRGRRLGRLIAAARALGKPVIFIRNVPAHLAPGLDWVAASCDAVSDQGFGVQLGRFNPVDLAAHARPTRSTPRRGTPASRPRCVPCWTRLPTPAGPVHGGRRYRLAAAARRCTGSTPLFVTVSAGPGTRAARLRRAGDHGHRRAVLDRGDRVAARCGRTGARARAAGRRPAVLREIFTEHATPAGWPGWPGWPGCPVIWSPGGRSRCWPGSPMRPGPPPWPPACARSGSRPPSSSWRSPPGPGSPPRYRATRSPRRLGGLAPRGTTVTAIPAPSSPADSGWLWLAARTARSPWVAPWQAGREYDESLPARPGLRAGVRAGGRGRVRRVQPTRSDRRSTRRWPGGSSSPPAARPRSRATALLRQLRS